MAEQVSNGTVLNIFKKTYGDTTNLVPEGFPLLDMIKFTPKSKTGESYNEAVILTGENGWTLGGTAADLFEINPAKAGAVKQASITPYVSLLSTVVPWSVLSRSAGGGDVAFKDGTKHLVYNNLKSHMSLLNDVAYYGQSPELLGYVSYATATYRGVSLTTGTGTVGGVAFTTGVSTSAKAILMAPGQFASGIWIGKEGATINQVDASGVVVASGSLVSIDSENGILYVDFTPVAASSATSHRICFDGMENGKEMIGVHKILTNTGTLFGVPAAQFSLWKGSTSAAGQKLLTFGRLQKAAAQAMNRGGLGEDVEVKVNPRTFATMINDQAAARDYDHSYGPAKYENGAKAIEFYYAGGKMTVEGDRKVKEGHAFGLVKADWVRGGSAEISLNVPGVDKPIIFPLENHSGHMFRSFSDQYLFCRRPAAQFFISGIDDESAS